MTPLHIALLAALGAGAAIPLGAALAHVERLRLEWKEKEFRHAVVAFGGGALLAAVSLVLVPKGIEALPPWVALAMFAGGGLAFMLLDRRLGRSGTSMGQLIAMIADFLPEALALGAMFASGDGAAMLLALLIALQNLPEGFNAYCEMMERRGMTALTVLLVFSALALIGPLAAGLGHVWLPERPGVMGAMMLFAAGGILYLTFQDIAPKAQLEKHWTPPLGAVLGFLLGLAGHLFVG